MKKYKMYIILAVLNIVLLAGNIFILSKTIDVCHNTNLLKEELRLANETLESERNIYESIKVYGRPSEGNGFDKPDFSYTKPGQKSVSESTGIMNIPRETKQKLSVCIDAGHGITKRKESEPVSPGSSAKKAGNVVGTAGEEEFNLSVAMLVKERLEAAGITVDMTRTTHECDKTNTERAEQGNKSDYCIRIHADGNENTSAHGISVLIPEKSYYGDDAFVPESRAMAECILEETVANTGAKKVGVITRSDLTGFNWSKVPVVLIECGFLSNPEERAKLQTVEYQQKIADGIADGFLKYIKNKQGGLV